MKTDFHYLTQEKTKRLLATISSKRDRAYPGGALHHTLYKVLITQRTRWIVKLQEQRIEEQYTLWNDLNGIYCTDCQEYIRDKDFEDKIIATVLES